MGDEIYIFGFLTFLRKNSKIIGVKIYIFGFLKNVSQTGPFHTSRECLPGAAVILSFFES